MDNREKILIAAKKLFLEKGFSSVSMDAIATSATVSHGLIFHHFGSKENLWTEVKQYISEKSEQHSPVIPDLALDFPVFIKKFIENAIQYYQKNPELIRMINWQRTEYKKIGMTLSRGLKKWMDVFVHYQNIGQLNPTLKPEYMVTFFAATVSSMSLDKNIFITNKTELESYVQFCSDAIIKAFGKII